MCSDGGQIVKLLACEARGLMFDPQSLHLDFRDWVFILQSDVNERLLKPT